MIRRNNSISVLLILILILHGTNVKSFTLPSPLQKVLILAEGFIAKQKVNKNLDPNIRTKFKVESDETFAAQRSNDGATTTTTTFSHALWDSALKKHATYVGDIDGITTTLVDYVGMSKDPDVLRYTQALATVDLEQLGSANANANNSANELLALYINAYNCFCIGHVTKYYLADPKRRLPSTITAVTKTMTDYKKTDIWDVPAGKIGRRTVTLNEIEHTILRSCWDDPRIHAAIVCASASCPNLRSEAFVGAKLNAQLDDQAQNWVSDTKKGLRYNPNNSQQLLVSRIFLWFQDDFQSNYGGPLAWAQQYASTRGGKENDNDNDPKQQQQQQQQLAAWSKLSTDDYEKNVEYFPYNWKLNDRRWERQD
ncbi:hypothetical protein FRACYDRAFT_249460 [Fragilariopsis cylindrus CCMP1102]|uniref:DUF547 domain-containing protein n=1 Tax=Fragilariopsis cylindrus CCMP1102 TaxID=635003 RepID=A0A1E7ERF7_9STRA|nr:hypothetical protein FRACYDRAFT_249460 [Fragilariopsis cylindrus CCMP1102]|eukprot:OEU08568.1 hypothetical protein FRACYDRAFT_249460 [Fragilariopsis cylindrus CCMP1102]